jgi:hypothetical protein
MRSPFHSLVAAIGVAFSFIVHLPARAAGFVVDLFDTLVLATDTRALADLFRAGGSSGRVAIAGDVPIDAALATDQRHEAGLARLGAVRHR